MTLNETLQGLLVFMIMSISMETFADTFFCQDPRGKRTVQQIPCAQNEKTVNSISGLAASSPHQAIPPSTSPFDSSFRELGFDGMRGYNAAKAECMKLLRQANASGAYSRCPSMDMRCLERAGQEMLQSMDSLSRHPAWRANNCDTVVQLEGNRGGNSYEIQAARNDEWFIVNDNKYRAKTYCFGQMVGDRVVFTDGSAFGACTSAKWVNKRNDSTCDVWCE